MLYDEAEHPDATDLTRNFSPGNSDAMDILTLGLGLGLGLGRVLGLELGRQDVPGLKNTGVNFLVSDRSRQDVTDVLYDRYLKRKAVQKMSRCVQIKIQAIFLNFVQLVLSNFELVCLFIKYAL